MVERKTASQELHENLQKSVYTALSQAGDMCRIHSSNYPDLTDAIAAGISQFLAEGDIFDHVLYALLKMEAKSRELGSLDTAAHDIIPR